MTSLNAFLSSLESGPENNQLQEVRSQMLHHIVIASVLVSTLTFVLLFFTPTGPPSTGRIVFWLIAQTILWLCVFMREIPHPLGSVAFFFALYLMAAVELYSRDGIFVGSILLLFIPILAVILIGFRGGLFSGLVALILFAASPNYFAGLESVNLLNALNQFSGPLPQVSFIAQIVLFLAVCSGIIYVTYRYRNLVQDANIGREQMIKELNENQDVLDKRIESRVKTIQVSTALNQEISNILGEHGLARTVVERIMAERDFSACQLFFFSQTDKHRRSTSIYQNSRRGEGITLPGKTISLEAEPYTLAMRTCELQLTDRAPHLDASANTNNQATHQRLHPHENGNTSTLATETNDHYADHPKGIMPIFSGKEVSGLMIIYKRPGEIFTQDDQFFIKTVASQIAISLRNAKIYQRATRLAQNELIVQSLFEKLQNVNSIPEVLKISAAFIGNHLEKDVKLSIGVNPNNPFQK